VELAPLPPSVLRKILELAHWDVVASSQYSWTFCSKGKILRPVPNNVEFVASETIQSILEDAEIPGKRYPQLLEQAKHEMNIVFLPHPPSTTAPSQGT
jgi:hypothetical protein